MGKKKAKPVVPRMEKAKSYIDRAKAIMEEQRAYGADLTEVCKEAKENDGLDPSMIRFAAREALIDDEVRRERDDKRAEYLNAIGLAVELVRSGLSLRQAEAMTGASKSSIQRALAVPAVSRAMELGDIGEWLPPHDLVTGEVVETGIPVSPVSIMPSADTWLKVIAVREAHHAAIEAEKEAAKERRRAEREARAALNARVESDDLVIPAFLRRTPAEAQA